MLSKGWLGRYQIGVYAAAILLAIGIGTGSPGSASLFEPLITPVLAVMLYATFLEIPFVRLRRAFAGGRFVAAALGMNFLVVPIVVWCLTRPLSGEPAVLVGALMVLLTPCIDYVIAFTDLADGDAERVTAATPVLMLGQLLLLPAYLWLFVGPNVAASIEAGPFVEAFFLLIALPLSLAWLTEIWAERSATGARWRGTVGWLPVPTMAATLLVVITSQLPRVQDSIETIVAVVPTYVAFLAVMPLLGRLAAGRLRMDVGEGRALVFTATTRNSLVVLPLALALPAGYELAPAVVVTQTIVELAGMVVLTRAVPAWLLSDPPRPLSIPALARDD
ncbi:arsenic resistance protein [Halegenticoccus tardaugens]|uniref:arsenic resistance protein n=1 Tax=Halegenticoccus tardaugens TaxID=2071624 RepID=UPI00100C1B93|nr:arsenic resistance protein [Halegenticoccus tardaugens]